MKRSLLGLLALVALTAACDALPVDPTPAPTGLDLAFGGAPPAQFAAVLARVDNIGIRVVRPDGGARDTTIFVTSTNGEVHTRIVLEPRELVEGVRILVELRAKTSALFAGAAVVEPREGGLAAHVLVSPIAGRIVTTPTTLTFDAMGGAVPLSGTVQFLTGELIPGAVPTWSSDNPVIVEVTSNAIAIPRSNGETALQARYGSAVARVFASVRQLPLSITEIIPRESTVAVGQGVLLRPTGVDLKGYPLLPGARIEWKSQTNAIALVNDTGFVSGRAPGTVTISAGVAGKVLATAKVTVTLASPIPSEATVRAPGGDLTVGPAVGTLGLSQWR